MKRTRLSKNDSKPRASRMSRVAQLAKFGGQYVYDHQIRDAEQSAIRKKFEAKYGTYPTDKLMSGIDDRLPVAEQFRLLENALKAEHGTVSKFNLRKDFDNFDYRVRYRDAVQKGKKVMGFRDIGYFVVLPADEFYALAYNVLKGEYLPDRSKVLAQMETQKKAYYSPDGIVKTDLFTMERFKNGRVDVTFNDEASAKNFLDAIKKLGMGKSHA